jgi:hypothetical protein
MQAMVFPWMRRPMQASLAPVQMRISSTRPAAAFLGISGSAMIARVIATASAQPWTMTSSACAGWTTRPATITGIRTTAFTAAAKRL